MKQDEEETYPTTLVHQIKVMLFYLKISSFNEIPDHVT